MKKFLLITLLFITTSPLYATSKDTFEKIFSEWTDAFNHKELSASCDLFSKSVIANYRGAKQKNYHSICEGFKRVFQEKNRDYHYHFKIKNVYQSGNLAAVRITWYLKINENGHIISTTQDEGLDILERNKQGKWQIIHYLAYPVNI